MGTIKDRKGVDLIEVEEIKKRCPQQPTFTWCQERLSQATHRYVHRAHGRAPVAQQTKEAF